MFSSLVTPAPFASHQSTSASQSQCSRRSAPSSISAPSAPHQPRSAPSSTSTPSPQPSPPSLSRKRRNPSHAPRSPPKRPRSSGNATSSRKCPASPSRPHGRRNALASRQPQIRLGLVHISVMILRHHRRLLLVFVNPLLRKNFVFAPVLFARYAAPPPSVHVLPMLGMKNA